MDLTKAKDFLEKQGLDDCHYQDSGMMEHMAENMQRYADQQLKLYIVSGMLPNEFKQLPEKLQCKLVRKHTHAELVDGDKIVYEEQDVLDIIKYVSEGNYR